jgi:3-oxoacyl-[acyl-carrier protein] reductase
MLLKNKIAVIYGAGGGIGRAVAHTFVRQGATLFLAGRTLDNVKAVAWETSATGGSATAAQVDALDEQAVDAHIQQVIEKAGRIDVLFNAIGMADLQGQPLVEMKLDDVIRPVVIATRTQFLTARAVARQMVKQGSGVILTITAVPDPAGTPQVGGFDAACAALEGLWRTFAAELAPSGLRFGVVRSIGSPDTPEVRRTFEMHAQAAGKSVKEYLGGPESVFLLQQMPPVALVADTAARLAADLAHPNANAFTVVTCDSALA